MGFRNPVTTVTDVDTRITPAGAGVRVYEDNTDPAQPRGVVEFRTGFGTDLPATITQHAVANQRAENASDTGGLRLDGGSYNASTAPVLDLMSVNNGDGTYSSRAALTGGALTLDRPATSTGAAEQWTDLPFIAGAWAAWDTGANLPRYRRDVAGDCHVRGIVKIAAGGGFTIPAGASGTVCTLPAGFFLPGATTWAFAAILNASGVLLSMTQAQVSSTGVLTVVNNTAAAAVAGYGFCLGLTFPTT